METGKPQAYGEALVRQGQIRYPLAAAILGVLICTCTWMYATYVQSGYHTVKWYSPDNTIDMLEFGLTVFDPFAMAVFPLLCACTGLALFVYGMVRLFKISQGKGSRSRAFSVTCLILGIVFLILLTWYLGWLEPPWAASKVVTAPEGQTVTLYRDPGWIRLQYAWKALSFLLGGAVVGLNVFQLWKEKRKSF